MADYMPFDHPKWRDGKYVETAEQEQEMFGDVVVMCSGYPAGIPAEYTHHEYPKMVGDTVVNNEDEELAALEAMSKQASPQSPDPAMSGPMV